MKEKEEEEEEEEEEEAELASTELAEETRLLHLLAPRDASNAAALLSQERHWAPRIACRALVIFMTDEDEDEAK